MIYMRIPRNRFLFPIIYIVSAILIYLVFIIKQRITNTLIISLLIALIITLFFYFLTNIPKNIVMQGMSRYTMKCTNCNWEWMSNIAEKAPDVCPRCKKHKLEIIGWRKVSVEEAKSNKTLQDFLK